ncbi:MAG: NAD(P)-dependent glycerol-3-phosphate dehydrogenase [Oligoflexia bacterium]|nr:NAD(P)-dependent glycerol-3-phosphate dehydrogenase [Oligoflexia bacterium]
MEEKAFWSKAKVAVIGAGNFGTVLASLVSKNCLQVRLLSRSEEQARAINSTRLNPSYMTKLSLAQNITAFSEPERVFEGGVQAVIWALPSQVCRQEAKVLAPYFGGDEILIHTVKGVEEGSLKRISVLLREEIPCPRIGVISGPNLAEEIGRGEPAATVVASDFEEVVAAGQALLTGDYFRVYPGHDVIGVEWAGALKNILAIAAGAVESLQLGWNARALLITRGLAEMVRFGMAMGAKEETFLGLSGVGDLLATCSSPLSRNYRTGLRLAKGESLDSILQALGSVAEGVKTTRSVREFAHAHGIDMPVTEGVYHLLEGKLSLQEIIQLLMTRPTARP